MPKTCDDGNIANFVCGTFLWKKFKHMAKARIIKFTHIHINIRTHIHIFVCVCHRITVREPPPFAFIEWKASIHANFTRAAQCRMRAHCCCCCCFCLCLWLCCCSASLLLSFSLPRTLCTVHSLKYAQLWAAGEQLFRLLLTSMSGRQGERGTK